MIHSYRYKDVWWVCCIALGSQATSPYPTLVNVISVKIAMYGGISLRHLCVQTWTHTHTHTHTRTHFHRGAKRDWLTLGFLCPPTVWSVCCGWQNTPFHCPAVSLQGPREVTTVNNRIDQQFTIWFQYRVTVWGDVNVNRSRRWIVGRKEKKGWLNLAKLTENWRVGVAFHSSLFQNPFLQSTSDRMLQRCKRQKTKRRGSRKKTICWLFSISSSRSQWLHGYNDYMEDNNLATWKIITWLHGRN